MIEYIIWVISFISLFLGIFWVNVLYLQDRVKKNLNFFPSISIIVPAFNEEDCIESTLESISELNYKRNKLRVIVVNDDSTDNTGKVVERFIKKNNSIKIELINRKKKPGQFNKAPAFNEALKKVRTNFVACVDADTILDKESLQYVFQQFSSKKIGAVISVIKVKDPKTIWEKIQRLEYIFATFIRKLMSKVETLHVTPGALSVYRTKLVKKFGGLDEENITEDLEIAMKLHYHGYKVRIALDSITYTGVPKTFKALWNQRVRWFRGFIYNTKKYRKMLMNKKYGLMGLFQYPVNIITLCTIIVMFMLISYEIISNLYNFIIRLIIVRLGIINLMEIPSFERLLFGINLKVAFPLLVVFMLALYIYYKAHETLGERWRFPTALVIYLSVYPIIRGLHWITAFVKESLGVKKKW